MRAIKTVVMLLAVASFAVTGYAATNLPFSANFDSLADDEQLSANAAWSYSIAPIGVSGTPDGSARGIYAADGVTLNISGSNSNVWWFSYAKVRAHSDPPSIGTDAAAFYVNTAGELMAYSNTLFVSVASGVPTNTWVRFAVRLDYGSQRWDLYMANPHTATLTKRNALPLAFRSGFAGAGIAAAQVTGETYLDTVSAEVTTVSINPAAQSPVYVRNDAPLLQVGDAATVSLQYIGLSGNLQGPLGRALGKLFDTNDTITFWSNSVNALVKSTWDGTDWDADLEIIPTTGIFVSRSKTGTTGTVAYDATYSHKTAPAAPISAGWNLLAIPATASATSIRNSGLPAGVNDYVFLRSDTGWSISRHDGTTWTSNIKLPSGRTFWLRRNGEATTWDTSSLD